MTGWPDKLKQLFDEWRTYSSPEKVLIYQMGKVGSTSLANSIPGSIQLHALYETWTYPTHVLPVRPGLIRLFCGRVADLLRRRAIRCRETVQIITMVRDPYARNLSMYFQHLPLWLYHFQYQSGYNTNHPDDISMLFDAFEEAFDHDYPLHWFDLEIRKLTGINVYEHPFDKEAGYSLIEHGKYRILILQLEKMNDNSDVISRFIGNKVQISNANMSKNKWYADIYREFKNRYHPRSAYLDTLYASRYSKHFYTEQQLESFKRAALKSG